MRVAHSIAMLRLEEATGKRFCISCNDFIAADEFSPGHRRYQCHLHFKESRRNIVKSTPAKRAINSLRARAHMDMRWFDQHKMTMGVWEITTLLTPEQLADFSKFAIMPVDPAAPLSIKNAAAITTAARSSIMSHWKAHHDIAEYMSSISGCS